MIYGSRDADETYKQFGEKPPCLLYTSSTKGVFLRTNELSEKFSIKSIRSKSTIGAGDNFNAGIVYSLFKNNIRYKQVSTLKLDDWRQIIETAVEFASHVCEIYDNYISEEFAEKYRKIK